MKVVKVYGALRKKLGQCRFQFEADTPAQAFKALCVNFPGLDKWLVDSEKDGVTYRVTIGKEKINEDNFGLIACPWSEREVFSITPVLAGAGRTGAMIGIGVGLVAFAVLTAGAGTGFLGLGAGLTGSAGTAGVGGVVGLGGALGTASTGFVLGGAASVAIGGIGAALILGGIANALSPSSTNAVTNSIERGRNAAKLESFSFSGVVNTAKQGLPVPIAYGRVFVGSAVLSSGLDVDQV